MGRKKHKWHCGECHHDLIVMRRQKGTKYLYCPHCDKQVAYFNIAPLIAAALSALAPTLIEKGGEIVSGLVGGKKTTSETPHTTSPHLSGFEKAILLERAEAGHHTRRRKHGR